MKLILKLIVLLLAVGFTSCNKDDDAGSDPSSNDLNTGASAGDILSDENFEHLLIEIQYPEGFAPPAGSVSALEDFITTYCHKPGGVSSKTREISIPSKNSYSLKAIRDIEDAHRTAFSSADTLAVYIFLADAGYAGNSGNSTTLGIAYRNTSFVVFQKTVKEHSGGLTGPSEELVTSSIFLHEMGHLMGLVDVGTPMVNHHEDASHQHHCNNEDCLMYWAVQSADAVSNLLGSGGPPELGSQCQADLEANGGK